MSLRIINRIGLLVTAMAFSGFLVTPGSASIKDGRSPDTKGAANRAPQQVIAPMDGRSPDTKDASLSVPLTATQLDLRSPDTRDAAAQAHPTQPVADLRSPDTRDAAIAAHSAPPQALTIIASHAFDWMDASIGAAAGFMVALLLSAAVVLRPSGRRKLAL